MLIHQLLITFDSFTSALFFPQPTAYFLRPSSYQKQHGHTVSFESVRHHNAATPQVGELGLLCSLTPRNPQCQHSTTLLAQLHGWLLEREAGDMFSRFLLPSLGQRASLCSSVDQAQHSGRWRTGLREQHE
jgi:hypothetical protein